MYFLKKIIKKVTPTFVLSWYHLFLAYFANFIYKFPSNKVGIIGVVGTRGKTSTANFIWAGLTAAGYKTGLTSTANIRIGEKEMLNPFHMTMPGRFALQKLISKMAKEGCSFAVIETPSEGIEQWRHIGINYDIVVFTRLYPEYLEAHNQSFERLKEMNFKIFSGLAGSKRKIINAKKIPKAIIVNSDDEHKDLFLKFDADQKITYGTEAQADLKASNIRETKEGVDFDLDFENFKLRTVGVFNVYNALAAIAVCSALDLPISSIQKGFDKLEKIEGRMEKIEQGQPFKIFVDYAHDAVSIEALLDAARKITDKKIILLLGAEGGGRDKTKRPVMGEIGARKADFLVISNVDPYDDDPLEIIEDIAQGAEKGGKIRDATLFPIEDRREGIKKSLSLAGNGDVVLITGKGAEQTLIIKNKKIPWDDRTVVREELNKILNYKSQ